MEAKKHIDSNDSLSLFTYNINTGEKGVASFYTNGKKLKVFEGNEDGSDDKEMNYNDFVNNYNFIVANEYDDQYDEIKI